MVTLAKDGEDEIEETEKGEYAREESEVDLWWRTAEGLLVDEGAGEGEGYDCEEELNASQDNSDGIFESHFYLNFVAKIRIAS